MKLTDICRVAIKANASDIHIKVGLPPLLRVNGDLIPLPNAPRLNAQQIGQMAWNIMSETQRETFKTTNDLDMAHTIQGVGRFRLNVFRQRGMVGIVIRAITAKIKSLDELGLPTVLKKIAMEPRGLIVVTGTTGSGKSTTLAAMIEEINSKHRHHIMTIEDPIEYIFQDRRSLINQREVGTDSSSFGKALRAAMRQDPDVILIGELRDKETVEIALSAAETGHLVLATLHTRDCPEAINRIVGFFEPHAHSQVRRQLSGIVRAILSQRLIPSIAGVRVPAVEVLINTGTISECIGDAKRHAEIKDHMSRGRDQFGTQTFDQAVLDLVQRDIVSKEDAMRYVNNPDELELRLSGINAGDW
jgi:twitching motility protein PilT